MPDTLAISTTLVRVNCWCGMPHAIPKALYDSGHESNSVKIHCPLGHVYSWTESESDKLRKELEAKEKRLQATARQRDYERTERAAAERRAAAARGQVTKLKKRIGKGVCPGCNRHFANVERHMATQHLDLASVKGDEEKGEATE